MLDKFVVYSFEVVLKRILNINFRLKQVLFTFTLNLTGEYRVHVHRQVRKHMLRCHAA